MSNQLQVLNQQVILDREFKIYGDADRPLFLAKDVASMIEHTNASKMIKDAELSEDDFTKITVSYNGDGSRISPPMTKLFLTEDGLYEVLMQSKLPIAKEFKKEVKRVLKQIRQTGGYIPINEYDSDESIMAKALIIANKTLEKKDRIIQELLPKSEQYDKFLNGSNYQTMNDVAKVIGVGRNKLFGFLRNQKILMWNNVPYQRFVEAGYFVVKESVIEKGFKTINTCQTFVLPKGVEYIEKKVKEKGAYLLSTIEI